MEIASLLARRRMVRSFTGEPVECSLVTDLCTTALWSPTAGHSAGVRMHVIGYDDLPAYFAVSTDEAWRVSSERFAGLSRAGAAVLVTSRPQDYEARYAAPDKAASGLNDRDAWPIPYWHTDAAMATMAFLLLLEEQGLQATLWGNFRHEAEVCAWAGITDEALFATVLLGHGDGLDHRSASLDRPVPSRSQRVRVVGTPRSDL